MSNYRRRMMQRQNDEVVDLSLQDIYGNPINRSTANCYIIKEAGQYKFPIVYGNSIKNGKVNTAAFTNNGGSYSLDFVNGVGSVISSPYLSFSQVVSIRNSDTDGLISNTKIINEGDLKFVIFDINSIPSTGGNIILSVDAAGAIMWSWHIWLWPYDLTPVEITNATGVKYNIMPVNLASKYDDDGIHIKNWFYQWGRPNPMLLPSAWNSTTDHTPGSITKASKAINLQAGIANPSTFYYNSNSPYNWFGDKSYYNLWDAACTGTGNSDNDTVKTVYDPCPVGWKVPNGNTFTGLSVLSSADGIVKMRRYSGDTVGVGFLMSGYRRSSDGSLYGAGSLGYVWLSSASSQDDAYALGFGSNLVRPQNLHERAVGYSVRPVQDDNIQLDVIMISFKIIDTTYQAENGMTWYEWCQSSYNTGGYYVDEGNQVRNSGHYVVDGAGSEYFAKGNIFIRGGYSYIAEIIRG